MCNSHVCVYVRVSVCCGEYIYSLSHTLHVWVLHVHEPERVCMLCGVHVFSHTHIVCVCIVCVRVCVRERGLHVWVLHACVSVGLCESVRVYFVVYTYMYCDVNTIFLLHIACVNIASVYACMRERIARVRIACV